MTNKQNFIVSCIVYFIIVVIWLIVFFGHANAQTVDAQLDRGYDCFNYEIKLAQMQSLQSTWLRVGGRKKAATAYRINRLYPSYMDAQVLCLWFTHEPN